MGIEQLKNARIEGNKLFFDAELIEEGSWGSHSIGVYKNQMEFVDYGFGTGDIIWNYGKNDVDEEETTIGLEFDENGEDTIMSYDGVMNLPREAVVLLEHLGYNCDYVKDE